MEQLVEKPVRASLVVPPSDNDGDDSDSVESLEGESRSPVPEGGVDAAISKLQGADDEVGEEPEPSEQSAPSSPVEASRRGDDGAQTRGGVSRIVRVADESAPASASSPLTSPPKMVQKGSFFTSPIPLSSVTGVSDSGGGRQEDSASPSDRADAGLPATKQRHGPSPSALKSALSPSTKSVAITAATTTDGEAPATATTTTHARPSVKFATMEDAEESEVCPRRSRRDGH
jgi:hypothetical protein